ncbi:MAG TPA: GNAT family N-acetyltransferase [Candidatus Acidoferrum sp.]|nr:GNAT family N-acetyltransferase [Candidatus Acidoferrum sp.]
MSFVVKATTDEDQDYICEIFNEWGADFVVTNGRKTYYRDVSGFYVEDESGERIGLITYQMNTGECEIVTLNSSMRQFGIGSALIAAVIEIARAERCRRVWLITTNDNVNAIRFYQLLGFSFAALRVGAIEHSRRLKPSIPLTGRHGIPIRDELEFEFPL